MGGDGAGSEEQREGSQEGPRQDDDHIDLGNAEESAGFFVGGIMHENHRKTIGKL